MNHEKNNLTPGTNSLIEDTPLMRLVNQAEANRLNKKEMEDHDSLLRQVNSDPGQFEETDDPRESLLTLKKVSDWCVEARMRPDPKPLWLSLWHEGEISCLFADSNLGKSIYAVEIARHISRNQPVVYYDFELSDKQFQLRYTDENGYIETFYDDFMRAEINTEALSLDSSEFEQRIMESIEITALNANAKVLIIDNLSFLCNNSDKSDMAGRFMLRLIDMKRRLGLSILVLAHTPKRSLSSPITQNDLAGSKKLFNFFDSVFAIGKSARDESLRYIKQLKVRAGSFDYGTENVIVCEIVKDGSWLHFESKGFDSEREHLKDNKDMKKEALEDNIREHRTEGKTITEIAALLGISKSTVGRICKKLSI